MSQTSRSSKGGGTPRRSSLPAILSALAVVAVFVLLGVMLWSNRPGAPTTTAAQPTADAAPTSAAPAEAAPTPGAAGADAAAVAARNDKYRDQGAPPMTIDASKTYTATIETPRGDIVVALRPDIAPTTVNNFVFLAREGFYDGTTWHRVLANFMAQGGDPTGTGTGGPGYTVPAEFTDQLKFDRPGLVAMARGGDPDSAGSQFFITTAAAPWLDDPATGKTNYTVFGEVVSGQDIVNGIPLRDPDNPADLAAPGEEIVKITIDEG